MLIQLTPEDLQAAVDAYIKDTLPLTDDAEFSVELVQGKDGITATVTVGTKANTSTTQAPVKRTRKTVEKQKEEEPEPAKEEVKEESVAEAKEPAAPVNNIFAEKALAAATPVVEGSASKAASLFDAAEGVFAKTAPTNPGVNIFGGTV